MCTNVLMLLNIYTKIKYVKHVFNFLHLVYIYKNKIRLNVVLLVEGAGLCMIRIITMTVIVIV